MAKRNTWEHDETIVMLKVMDELNILRHFDSKIYRNSEVYRKVEAEMGKRGYSNKDAKQIEIRWKNLKRIYIATKKNNNRSGRDRQLCVFYEELDRLIGARPNVNTVQSGVDTSRREQQTETEQTETENVVSPDPVSDPYSELPSTSKAQTKRKNSSGYAACLDKLAIKIKKSQELSDTEFFKKQEEIMNLEFQRFDERLKLFEAKYEASTKQIVEESTNKFLEGLNKILNPGSSTRNNLEENEPGQNIKDFITSFSVDEDDL